MTIHPNAIYEIEVGKSRIRGSFQELVHLRNQLVGIHPIYIIHQSKLNDVNFNDSEDTIACSTGRR